jgi:cyclopropane fatty-acyl-phospholipid synthase-like methyltransferase
VDGPDKPHAPAAERNAAPILAELAPRFASTRRVLEIGTGTGQHAVHFAAALDHLVWLTSDLPGQHAGIRLWLEEAALPNIEPPLSLDVLEPWPALPDFDAAFTANTFHIMPWDGVPATFSGLAERLPAGAPFIVYGPFAYSGAHTAPSNARFDAQLRAADPRMGVRDIVDVAEAAEGLFELEADVSMPANNRLLIWRRLGSSDASGGTAR